MRRLPDAELELMMIVWDAEEPITRMEIEGRMEKDREVLPNTVLVLLSRLEKKGFVKIEKRGKINYYSPLVEKAPYLKETGKGFLKKLFQGSLANFATALYEGEELGREDTEELMKFLESQMRK